jgi:hypothetical protein
MSFSETSYDVELLYSHVLRAKCKGLDGQYHTSELDLNTCIGNSNGELRWGGSNFSEHARDVWYEGVLLGGRLRDNDGHLRETKIYLNEHIANLDGRLAYV